MQGAVYNKDIFDERIRVGREVLEHTRKARKGLCFERGGEKGEEVRHAKGRKGRKPFQ